MVGDSVVLREGEPSQVAMDGARVQRARELLRSHVEDGGTPSLVAVVARHGVVVVAEAMGQRGTGPGSVHLDDPFNLFSLTKPVTATLVMMLAEDGLLSINRPVVDYLPEMTREGNDRILLSHLLTHTSGFERGATQAVALERLKRERCRRPPTDSTSTPSDARRRVGRDPVLRRGQSDGLLRPQLPTSRRGRTSRQW